MRVGFALMVTGPFEAVTVTGNTPDDDAVLAPELLPFAEVHPARRAAAATRTARRRCMDSSCRSRFRCSPTEGCRPTGALLDTCGSLPAGQATWLVSCGDRQLRDSAGLTPDFADLPDS